MLEALAAAVGVTVARHVEMYWVVPDPTLAEGVGQRAELVC
jgi:hypothetical protein